jgi:hypothetical protein
MEPKRKYEVGDTVIGYRHLSGYTKHEVVRVTNTHAILENNIRIRRDEINRTGAIATDDLMGRYIRDEKVQYVRRWARITIDAAKELTDEKLDILAEALKKVFE